MSKGVEVVRAVASRMGLILVGVGVLLFGLEIYTELTRLPATGEITHIWDRCRLKDTSVRRGEEMTVECKDVAAQQRLHPKLDKVERVPHAVVNFTTADGQQIRTAATLRNLYANEAKPGQRIEILYAANEPKRISGHAHLMDFLEFAAFFAIGAGLMALARWFKPNAGKATEPVPAMGASHSARQRFSIIAQTRSAAPPVARRLG
jgi:hypothetical protein